VAFLEAARDGHRRDHQLPRGALVGVAEEGLDVRVVARADLYLELIGNPLAVPATTG
jgi:hypothetical protein